MVCSTYRYMCVVVKCIVLTLIETIMDQENIYAVLLQDIDGFKEEISFVGYGKQLKPVTVAKGSLLIRLNPSVVNAVRRQHDYSANFRVDSSTKNLRDGSSKNTEILSVNSNVLYFLSEYQRDLLLGIKNPRNRLEVLGRLEWVESLRKGDEVYVTIATIIAPVRGVIRYIGGLPGEDGRKFGIELRVRLYVCIYLYMVITHVCQYLKLTLIKPGACWQCAPGFKKLILSATCVYVCVCPRPQGY